MPPPLLSTVLVQVSGGSVDSKPELKLLLPLVEPSGWVS
jgi:hypothetical protein